jgi:lipopolysaccharide export system permease protein
MRVRPRHWLDAVVDTLRFDRLDRYVARYFVQSVAVVLLFFVGFFMVIDLCSHADEFVENSRRLGVPARTMAAWVGGYYLYKLPSVFLQVAPFVTVIGGILAVARLVRQNELVPVLMSGRSVFRMLRPLFVCATLLTGGMLLVQEFVAPSAADRRLRLEWFLCKGETAIDFGPHVQVRDDQGGTWSDMKFEPVTGEMVQASVVYHDASRCERTHLSRAHYDAARRGWTQEGGVALTVDDDRQGRHERVVDLLPSSLTPAQVTAQEKEPFDLSFADLGQLFGRTAQPRFQVLLHYHVTFPITNLLLLLLAIPFVLRYDRQRIMQGFAIAFFLCVAYFGVDAALRGLGEHRLHPVLAAWFAPLFFGALGISLFDGVRT